MNKKTLFFVLAILVFFAVGVVFIMNTSSNTIPGSPQDLNSNNNEANFKTETKKVVPENNFEDTSMKETTPDSNDSKTDTDADTKEFVIEAGSFYYKPNTVRVSKGDKVKITINSVSMMHDLNIEDYGVATSVAQSGKSASVEFTADKVGRFEMYCSVGQHRANGQVGVFIVE